MLVTDKRQVEERWTNECEVEVKVVISVLLLKHGQNWI